MHPWEFERSAAASGQFRGSVRSTAPQDLRAKESVLAVATTLVPAAGSWSKHARLWVPPNRAEFDLEPFSRGDYMAAAAPSVLAENISRVLYPDDTTEPGRELRLKQQYFFTAASIADILRRFLAHHDDVARLPRAVAIQLNDTHPAIASLS